MQIRMISAVMAAFLLIGTATEAAPRRPVIMQGKFACSDERQQGEPAAVCKRVQDQRVRVIVGASIMHDKLCGKLLIPGGGVGPVACLKPLRGGNLYQIQINS